LLAATHAPGRPSLSHLPLSLSLSFESGRKLNSWHITPWREERRKLSNEMQMNAEKSGRHFVICAHQIYGNHLFGVSCWANTSAQKLFIDNYRKSGLGGGNPNDYDNDFVKM